MYLEESSWVPVRLLGKVSNDGTGRIASVEGVKLQCPAEFPVPQKQNKASKTSIIIIKISMIYTSVQFLFSLQLDVPSLCPAALHHSGQRRWMKRKVAAM